MYYNIRGKKMKYKIIAIDLDGTLVDSKKNISDYTCRIIRKYMEKGGIVVLASGRPTYGILPIAEKLKLEHGRGYILSYNGGELFECSSKKVIFQQTMPEDAPGKLNDFAKENGLSILTSGPIPPNPVELIRSNMMEQLINTLRDLFDVVIFDTPPVGLVTDAAIISSKLDGVVLVVASGKSQIEATLRAKENLQNVNANLLGAVVTMIPIDTRGYQYYTYGEEEQTKKKRR